MAYSTSNPPKLLVPQVGGEGPAIWVYQSADADSTVNGAGYISNAGDLGMQVGDFVLVYDTGTPLGSVHYVNAISSGAATLAFAAVA